MDKHTATYRTQSSTHPPYWCDDCATAHTGGNDEARSILGDYGNLHGVAYRWCARNHWERVFAFVDDEGREHFRRVNIGPLYHTVSPMSPTEAQRVALAALSRVINARYIGRTRVRMTWNASHNRPPAEGIRERVVNVDAFAAAYDAQRTRRAPMTRGGGNAYVLDRNAVPLTQASRRALAASMTWGSDARRAERARDIAALDARIAARDAA